MKKLLLALFLLIPIQLWAADSKVTDLTEDTTPTSDDILYIVDDPAGTPTSKKVTAGNLGQAITIPAGSIGANEIDEADTYSWTGQHTFADTIETLTSAGAPSAGSCTASGFHSIDTTNEVPYFCSDGSGGNPRAFTSMGDAYSQFSDGTYSATSSGADTMTVGGSDIIEAHIFGITGAFTNQPAGDGVEIISSSASDVSAIKIWGYRSGKTYGALTSESITLLGVSQATSIYTDWEALIAVEYPSTPVGTVTIREASGNATITTLDNASRAADRDVIIVDAQPLTKSVWIPASAMVGDGTNCPATPTAATINTGPKIYTFICGDNSSSVLYSPPIHMPDSWNGGTITLTQSYIQTAADTSALNGDVAAQCRGNTEVPSSTWGTAIAIDDAAVTGSNANDFTTSAAVTPAGTCAAGDMLYFKWTMDAGGTTTAVATLHFLGFKIEYTANRGGNDN